MPIDFMIKILDSLVDQNTLWIGFSSTFFKNLKKNYSLGKGVDILKETRIFLDEEEIIVKDFVKSKSPKCRFVVGGARAWLKNSGSLIDTYIEGYSDDTVIEFTRWCEGKNPFLMIEKHNNCIAITHDKKASRFDFVNHRFSWHESDHIFRNEALPIEVSRGCIFSCSFCNFPLNGKKKLDYIKDYGVLKDHFIENYEKYGTTRYTYSDDTHNDSPQKLEELYNQVYSKLPFKIKFTSYIRLDLLNAHRHTIELLKESGIESAFFGIESLNYESNKAVGKGMKLEKIVDTLSYVRDSWGDDIRTESGFIIGLPNDSEKTIREWLGILRKPDFPLHAVSCNVLQIKPEMATDAPWASDIDKDPGKFGYKMLDYKWINNTGLTFDRAWKIYIEDRSLYPNKINAFRIYDLMNVGCSFEEAKNLKTIDETGIRFRPEKFRLFDEYLNKIRDNKP
jgi:radical SAM superfamily enzyme YgiQ (UPF0313 family)